MIKLLEHKDALREIEKLLNLKKVVEIKLIDREDGKQTLIISKTSNTKTFKKIT